MATLNDLKNLRNFLSNASKNDLQLFCDVIMAMPRTDHAGKYLPLTREYDLDYQNLDKLPDEFPYDMKALYCKSNIITELPDNLPRCLYELDCNHNKITHIKSATLPQKLRILFVGSNNLSVIDKGLPRTLNTLYIPHNNITELPELPLGLKHLACDNNKLTKLPEIPPTCVSISCKNNNLTQLPALPASLTELSIADNNICMLPDLPASLTHFNFENNPLEANYPELSDYYSRVKFCSKTCKWHGMPELINYVNERNAIIARVPVPAPAECG